MLIAGQVDRLEEFVDSECFVQHDPELEDGLPSLRAALEGAITYERLHRVLADGNFVLAVSEGSKQGVHSAFYDLFHVGEGKLVEHWGRIATVAPESDWKSDNGKF